MTDTYHRDFGGAPTPAASQRLQLPSSSYLPAGLTGADLLDATSPDINRQAAIQHDKRFLRDTYNRVTHAILDDLWEDDDDAHSTLLAFEACHNGLWRSRTAQYLEAEDVYHLAVRLITWLQDQPEARLGSLLAGKWWVAPHAYVLLAGSSAASDATQPGHRGAQTPELGDQSRFGDLAQEHLESFDKARFTVHFVHFHLPEHWAVIILQRSTGNSWYIDSQPGRWTGWRNAKAYSVFKDWLQRSRRPLPGRAVHTSVPGRDQMDGWSCGLHAIANAMAFIRFEVLGWHQIPEWRELDGRQMRIAFTRSLHNMMGLDYQAPISPPAQASTIHNLSFPDPAPPAQPEDTPASQQQPQTHTQADLEAVQEILTSSSKTTDKAKTKSAPQKKQGKAKQINPNKVQKPTAAPARAQATKSTAKKTAKAMEETAPNPKNKRSMASQRVDAIIEGIKRKVKLAVEARLEAIKKKKEAQAAAQAAAAAATGAGGRTKASVATARVPATRPTETQVYMQNQSIIPPRPIFAAGRAPATKTAGRKRKASGGGGGDDDDDDNEPETATQGQGGDRPVKRVKKRKVETETNREGGSGGVGSTQGQKQEGDRPVLRRSPRVAQSGGGGGRG